MKKACDRGLSCRGGKNLLWKKEERISYGFGNKKRSTHKGRCRDFQRQKNSNIKKEEKGLRGKKDPLDKGEES